MLVENRLISGVGEGEYPEPVGANWVVIEGGGRFVTPGLIDPHSHMGVYPVPGSPAHSDGNEMVGPFTAGVEAIHSFWPQDGAIERAVAGGVTTIQVLPGSANLIGGHGATLKLHPRLSAQEMRFPRAKDGLKMACGENPKRVYGDKGGPQTRMGNIYRDRQTWIEAVEYARGWHKWEREWEEWSMKRRRKAEDEPEPPGRDLAKETLMRLLEGEIHAQIHCYQADDMLHMIDLSQEFGWEIRAFHHAIEAYKIRDVLAKDGIASVIWADWWGFKYEAYDATIAGPALSHLDGVTVALHSDSATGIQRLNHHAAQIYYEALDKGLAITEEDALGWITSNPAIVLGVEGQTGTLEVGKMADFVVWSAHPLSVLAIADYTFIDGEMMWNREEGYSVWSDFEVGQWPQEVLMEGGE